MLKLLKIKIKRILQYRGIFVQYYPSAKVLYQQLSNKHEKVQEYELKRVCKEVAETQNHFFYNSILRNFVPSWDIYVQDARFYGKGMGESSLNTYRKVKINGEAYLEKIYFNSFTDLEDVLWFTEVLSDWLSEEIHIVKPKKIFKGERISILYFPFLKLKKFPADKNESGQIAFSEKLYCLSNKKNYKAMESQAPSRLKNYRKHFLYQRNIDEAKQLFKKYEINCQQIETSIQSYKKVLTHGDLNQGNGFQNNILIDWDAFGFYPLGLDAAYIYYRNHLREGGEETAFEWLDRRYKQRILSEDWSSFRKSFLYFSFVFTCKLSEEHINRNIFLLNELK